MKSSEMISQRRIIADPTMMCMDERSVLLIAEDEDEAARVPGKLSSETEEQFRVEWATEICDGIERLREGCVKATVLDINLPGGQVAEISTSFFGRPPKCRFQSSLKRIRR